MSSTPGNLAGLTWGSQVPFFMLPKGMIYLLSAVIASVIISHLLRLADRFKFPLAQVFFFNYILASIIAWGGYIKSPQEFATIPPVGIILSVIGGITFIGTFYLYRYAVVKMPLGLAGAVSRMSAVLPILFSFLLFGESMSLAQVGGLVLALAVLPLTMGALPNKNEMTHLGISGGAAAILLFIAFGFNDFLFKLRQEIFTSLSSDLFLAIIFTTALFISLIITIRKHPRINPRAALFGLILGVVNFYSSYFLAAALKDLPGLIVYPLQGILIVAGTTITGALFWRDRLNWKSWAAIAGAMAAVWLFNIN